MAGLRITTWNVNGIRNPFSYQPWREKRTFEAMFDILEADIVVMQETKIQRKDLQDDMVLVPGWDVFFSLPKHKKGYSGVAIYTRNAACAPIRAEEGITGILTPPNSSASFYDLPKNQQIGGYPTMSQLSECALDASTLDSEGRCVILEFPAFVLIGVYSPANRDETRDDFRLGFLNALDSRVRNLVAMGKRVVLTGDLNIVRELLDTAKAEELLRKHGKTAEEFISTPAMRIFNQLVVDGKVFGERDEGREKPVMVDLCRSFHPDRKGMFTCWETKINARPGNFGSRIDYVLCSYDWKDWFSESNIQEGLIGSDHCPVFADLKEKVTVENAEIHIKDIMSPMGMFKDGVRQREWSAKDLLPLSARLIPEFDRRRSILDMFSKKPILAKEQSSSSSQSGVEVNTKDSSPSEKNSSSISGLLQSQNISAPLPAAPLLRIHSSLKENGKRASESFNATHSSKRSKSTSSKISSGAAKGQLGKGQSSLMGFFKPTVSTSNAVENKMSSSTNDMDGLPQDTAILSNVVPSASVAVRNQNSESGSSIDSSSKAFDPADQESIIDPIVAKESWSKLLGKRVAPRCDHDEPCISYKTKKPGENCGRFFYMCARPLGPSGQKEKNTQWRCGTFIWSSDWAGEDT